jgi:hypothetical protein
LKSRIIINPLRVWIRTQVQPKCRVKSGWLNIYKHITRQHLGHNEFMTSDKLVNFFGYAMVEVIGGAIYNLQHTYAVSMALLDTPSNDVLRLADFRVVYIQFKLAYVQT